MSVLFFDIDCIFFIFDTLKLNLFLPFNAFL